MIASVLTCVAIILVIAGACTFAFRRVTSVLRENRTRSQVREAELLAEVHTAPPSSPVGQEGEPEDDAVVPAPEPGVAAAVTRARPLVRTVEDDLLAFFGDQSTAAGGKPGETSSEDVSVAGSAGPSADPLAGPVMALSARLREAAAAVERAAQSNGQPTERAAAVVEAVGRALADLPVSEVLAAAAWTA